MSRIAARTRRRQLLASTFAVLGAMVLLLWLLVLGKVPGVFALLVIAAKQLEAIALIAFWMVIGGLLHGRQAKRLYAPIIAGGTLGRILGSFASGAIGRTFGIPALLPVAAVALALASLLAAQMRSVAPARVTRMRSRQPDAPPPVALGKFAPLWRESRLFRLLALSALLGGTLGPMLYFQFSYIVDLATRGSNGEMRLLELYAHLRGFINVGVLAMQLVGTSRIFRHIGVPFASTLSPVVYLLGFFGMSTRLDLPSGIGAVGGTNLQDHAIQDPAQQILITLFPERVRAVATSLIQGPVQRTGGAFGNLLVLAALWASTPASVGFTALPIAGMLARSGVHVVADLPHPLARGGDRRADARRRGAVAAGAGRCRYGACARSVTARSRSPTLSRRVCTRRRSSPGACGDSPGARRPQRARSEPSIAGRSASPPHRAEPERARPRRRGGSSARALAHRRRFTEARRAGPLDRGVCASRSIIARRDARRARALAAADRSGAGRPARRPRPSAPCRPATRRERRFGFHPGNRP